MLALAVLAGAALRFATLGQQSLDEDETVTVWLVHLSLPRMLSTIPHTESTPPLYYLLAWGWARVWGSGAVAIRSLSALIGVGAIPVSFLAARELFNRRAGAIAAALAAVSPALVWYSQEARSYELLVLTSAGALFYFARSLQDLRGERATRGTNASLVRWALLASLSLTTHYFAAFLVAPELLWLLAAARQQLRKVALAAGAVVIVGVALLPLALQQASNGGSNWIGRVPLGDRLADVAPQLLLGEGRPFYHHFALAVGLAAIMPVVVLLVRGGPDRRPALALALIGVSGVALPTLADVIRGTQIMIDRNTLGAAVVLLIACAGAMASSRVRPLGAVAFTTTAALFTWTLALVVSDPLHQREPWRDAARALGQAPARRAILLAPATTNPAPIPLLVPFRAVYLKDVIKMPSQGATVSEIDVLDVRDDLSDTSAPPDPVSPGRGFRLETNSGNRTYTLFRFRSRRPVHVTPAELIGEDLITNRDEIETVAGLQTPGR